MAIALVVRERLRGAREVRVLEIGTAVLFSVLAACAVFMTGVTWSVGLVRLVVDCGLMLLVLGGVAAGRPFTLPIARARVSPERAATPGLLRTSQLVAAAWAVAFGVLALADLVVILQPAWPLADPHRDRRRGAAGRAEVHAMGAATRASRRLNRDGPPSTGARATPTSSRRCGRSGSTGWWSASGYLINNREAVKAPLPPAGEYAWRYQFYLAPDHGKAGYGNTGTTSPGSSGRLSPPWWNFSDAEFDRSAASTTTA